MSRRRKLGIGGMLIVLVLLTWFLVLPSLRFPATRKTFPLGMALENARRIATPPINKS